VVSVLEHKDQGQWYNFSDEIQAEDHDWIPLIVVPLEVNDGIEVEDLQKVEREPVGVGDREDA